MGETVWLASYPKSGNTWFRAVHSACRVGTELDVNRLQSDPIASSRHRIDDGLGIVSSLLTHDEIDQIRPRADEALDSLADAPHLCKIHDAFLPGPAGEPIVSVAATRCAIYIVRDPRDVAVSFAHHENAAHDATVHRMADPGGVMAVRRTGIASQVRQRLGTWSEHVTSWLDGPSFPVHLVRYEDCIPDPVAIFTAALRFAGFDVTDDVVATAVESSSFERLQAQEAADGFRERPPGSTSFFRRGQSGGWRDELDPELARRIEKDHADVMARLGYV